MKKGNSLIGVLLLGLGSIALLNNIGIINFDFAIWKFWPLFLLIPGLVFELQYFNNDAPVGLLVPGGILTTYGVLFMYCSFFGYGSLAYLWPIFLGGVGVGLFQLYYFGDRAKPLFYVSASFLGFASFSIFFALLNIKGNLVFPAILIIIGGFILFGNKSNDSSPIISVEYENEKEEKEEVDL